MEIKEFKSVLLEPNMLEVHYLIGWWLIVISIRTVV